MLIFVVVVVVVIHCIGWKDKVYKEKSSVLTTKSKDIEVGRRDEGITRGNTRSLCALGVGFLFCGWKVRE